VKGRAGSPYAVKDYYSVNPDLAVDPAKRIDEFRALIERTHAHGMKVIIDIVPNHVARHYRSLGKPVGIDDFGAHDDTKVEYARDNNFYYIPGQSYKVTQWPEGFKVLGGEEHPLADNRFEENPAKWTGNGARAVQPALDDWYETVKLNYGVKPDGSHDFPTLPPEYANQDIAAHYAFWQGKDVPDTWEKFRDIALYWTAMGVDGFRYDTAELVPVEFWSYLNSHINAKNPQAFTIAETYNIKQYRDYLKLGKMDYLYDKVEVYDTVRAVMAGKAGTDPLVEIQRREADIDGQLLHFLENHDEQRIASPQFAGNAEVGRPGMLVSATMSTAPTMLYFAQEVGEAAAFDAGFGKASRTTIFDYWGLPSLQRWANSGKYDGGALEPKEAALREFYRRLLNFTATQPAMNGGFFDLHTDNRAHTPGYDDRLFAFGRSGGEQKLVIVASFRADKAYSVSLTIPAEVVKAWGLADGEYGVTEKLYGQVRGRIKVAGGVGTLPLELPALAAYVFELEGK
jgi:glycosidase